MGKIWDLMCAESWKDYHATRALKEGENLMKKMSEQINLQQNQNNHLVQKNHNLELEIEKLKLEIEKLKLQKTKKK